MLTVFKLAPPPPPPPRDYTADETCAAESLLMLSPSSATNSITPAAAAPPPAAVKKIIQELPPALAPNLLPHKCGLCGAAFKTYQALGGHKTRHRPKSTTADAVGGIGRVYECSLCPARFCSGQALGGHKRKHFGGTIFKKSKSCKTESPARDCSVVTTVIENDDDDASSSSRGLGFDLNVLYTHNFFE